MPLEVDGLTESRKALKLLPRDVDRAVDRELDDEAKIVERTAKQDAPSSHPSAPSSTAWIQRRGSRIVVSSRSEPRALATEFGKYGPSRGRYRGGGRQFNVWRGREGYVVIPAIRKQEKKSGKRVGFAAEKATKRTFDRARVPRG